MRDCSPGTKPPHERRPNTQLLDHRAYRPRKVDARRPPPRDDRRPVEPRDGAAGARLDGPRARARHHDQGAFGPARLQGEGRQRLRAEPNRHAGPRRLLVRSFAVARRVRGRFARRRRLAGRRGADAREHLPRPRQRPEAHPGHQQDRPAVGRARKGARADRADHRARDRQRRARVGEVRTRNGRSARGDRSRRASAYGKGRLAAQGAHLRLVVRSVPRRDRDGPRLRGHIEDGTEDPLHGRRPRLPGRTARRHDAENARDRRARPRRGRIRRRERQDRCRRPDRRHDHRAGEADGRGVSRLSGDQGDGVRRSLSDRVESLRGTARRAREAAAQRFVVLLRAGDELGARVRIPVRIPRTAPHGDRPGAARARIQPRAHHDRAERPIPGRADKR